MDIKQKIENIKKILYLDNYTIICPCMQVFNFLQSCLYIGTLKIRYLTILVDEKIGMNMQRTTAYKR